MIKEFNFKIYKINIDNRVRGREYEKRKFKDNTIRRTWRNR